MTHVALQSLDRQVEELVNRVRGGEKIVFTEGDLPIAVLSRVEADPEIRQAWTLVEAGLVSWSGGKPKPPAHPPKIKGRATSDLVVEDRR